MKIRITTDKLISINLLFLGIVSFFSFSIFDLGYTLNNIICLVSFGCILLLTCKSFLRSISPSCALFLLTFLLVLIRNHDLAGGNLIYVSCYASLVCVMVRYFNTNGINASGWIKPFHYFIYLFGLFCAAGTVLFSLIPDLYKTYVLPLTVGTPYYASLVYSAKHGYQPGFALHYSTNAIYLTLLVGVCFSNYLFPKTIWKGKNLLILLLAAVALLLTAKRAHIVFSLAAALVVYYSRNIDNKRARFFKMIFAIAAVVVAFVVVANYVPAVSNFIERFSTDLEAGTLFSGRNKLYLYAISLFLENPIFGIGWANYKYLAQSALGEFNEVHNVYLQILTETGIVGAMVFLVFFLLLIKNSFANFKYCVLHKERYSIFEQRITATSLFYVVFFFLYCISGNPLYDMFIWIPVMLYQIAAVEINRKISREISRYEF